MIPLALDIECVDQQALDIFTSSKAAQVKLLRILSMKYDSDCGRAGHSSRSVDLREIDVSPRGSFHDIVEELQGAVWWEPTPQNRVFVGNKRTLHGEIHLLSSLPPSAHLGHFRVSVSVQSVVCYISLKARHWSPSLIIPVLRRNLSTAGCGVHCGGKWEAPSPYCTYRRGYSVFSFATAYLIFSTRLWFATQRRS